MRRPDIKLMLQERFPLARNVFEILTRTGPSIGMATPSFSDHAGPETLAIHPLYCTVERNEGHHRPQPNHHLFDRPLHSAIYPLPRARFQPFVLRSSICLFHQSHYQQDHRIVQMDRIKEVRLFPAVPRPRLPHHPLLEGHITQTRHFMTIR